MSNIDTMMTFLDAWSLSERGENPSKAIENQERRGQAEVVRAQRLPSKLNYHSVPNEISLKGISDDMDYQTRRKISYANIEAYTKEQYEKIGIKVINVHDDLFLDVELPEGWEIKATDHSMWNEVRDEKGRVRMTFFYKAAFYDRDAFANLQTRFHLDVTHVADPNSDYEIWKASDLQGTVKDGDTIIYCTHTVPATGDYTKEDAIKKALWKDLEEFMNSNYPDYKNVFAYWD